MDALVSIIIPVYNAEKYLSRCLDSVIAQSYKDFEAICVDDGSSDRSGKILDEYKESDNRIKVVHKQNEGVSKARNKGIEISNGDFIVFLDADDYLTENCIEKLMNFSEKELVICAYHNLSKRNKILGPKLCQDVVIKKDLGHLWHQEYIPFWLYIWGKLYHSSIIKKNNIFFDTDMRYLEDFCFVLKYMSCIDDVFLINDVLVYHIWEPNKYSKYIMDFDEFDKHMKKNDTCFRLLEERCGLSKFTGMRAGIAYRHFYNFFNFIKSSDVSIAKKLIEVQKYKEQGRGGLYEYVKIPHIKIRLFWNAIYFLVSMFPKK